VRYKEASADIRKFLLTALLGLTAGMGFAQPAMSIDYIGGFDVPYSRKATSMQGDILALYDYSVTDQTITIKRGGILPDGTIQPQADIYTYVVNPALGYLTQNPLFFRFKNGKLYSAFKTDTTIIVLFSNEAQTDVHIFDSSGLNVYGNIMLNYSTFYIVNETHGYLSHMSISTPLESKIFKMDFSNDTLILFYDSPEADIYCFQSFDDDYILMYLMNSQGDDLLVQNDTIIQTITGGWGDSPGGYRNTYRLCGSYFHTVELQSAEGWAESLLVWVENNMLQRVLLDFGEYPYIPVHFTNVITQSDSTFSCIQRSMSGNSFQNLKISNHTISTDSTFPDLNLYNNPLGLCRMDEDYTVGIAGSNGSPRTVILVDHTDQSIRTYMYSIDDNTEDYWLFAGYNHSDRFLYVTRNQRVNIFALAPSSSNNVDTVPVTILQTIVYPNPFNKSCNVNITISRNTNVRIVLYNTRGQKVRYLYSGQVTKGESSFNWDGRDKNQNVVPSGIYIINVETDGALTSQKIVFLK